MSMPLYFPVIAQKSNSSQKKDVLCSLTLRKGEKPGLYPRELRELSNKSDSNFWQPLLRLAQRLPIELNSRGFTVTELKFSGSSATGCVSFFEKYDIDVMEERSVPLYIAISVTKSCDFDTVDAAQRVSNVLEKVELCIQNGMHIFVIPKGNNKELASEDERYVIRELDLFSKEELSNLIGEKLLVLLAGRDWAQKLADLLGLQERDQNEDFTFSPADNEDTDKRLYDLYITALAEDSEEDRKMLRTIFRGGGKAMGDTGMSSETFPWKVMHGEDEDGTPYLDRIFSTESLVLSGSTSTGKTTLAKALMLHALARGQRTVYIAPTRALVYEVYRDFCVLLEHMRDRAGQLDANDGRYTQLIEDLVSDDDSNLVLSTGEKNEKDGQVLRGDYRILFSVYEKANLFMNMMASQAEGRRPDTIIIDELHMLCDKERGGILDLFMGKVLSMPGQDEVRLIGITTEDKGAKTVTDFLLSLHKPATMLSIPQRPLPVAHYLLAGEKKALIATLHNTVHSISREEQRRIMRELRTKENVNFDPLIMLNSEHPDSHTPHKKVIGVFNSIAAIYRIVEKLSKDRLENSSDAQFCSAKTMDRLKEALDSSFINGAEKKILLKGIKAGIFVYYSPLDYKLREEMARAFQEQCDRTQILLTTEALAYGVNFPADAVYLTYLRETDAAAGGRGGDFIKRNLLFNILGRAGRLGKSAKESACCAFIALNGSDISLESDIKRVLKMYCEDSPFQVKTLDKNTEDGILVSDTVRNLDDVSFISFRSALDALRFVAANEDEKYTPVRNVRNFLEKTIYGWQFEAGQEQQQRRKELEELLSTLYKLTFEASPFQKNRLVEETSSDKDIFYSCTDLASALIDTGTSWKAIEPMSRWLNAIEGLTIPLPVELLLVGMLPVEELWGSIRSFDMLSRYGEITSTQEKDNERARNWLRDEVEKILPQDSDKKSDAEIILQAISSYVETACEDLVLSPKHKHILDYKTRLNSFSRLLAALFAWARGASSDEIQNFAFPGDTRDLANSFSPRYGERVCWLCLLCLRFFSKTKGIRLSPEHEGALQNLAMRMRYGVPGDCIPLMGTGRYQQNRTTVLKYREKNGITLQTVMQYSCDDYIRERENLPHITHKEYDVIKRNAIEYYCNSALDFCDLLTRGNTSDMTKDSLKQLQTFLQAFKHADTYTEKKWINKVKEALHGILGEARFISRWTIDNKLIIRSKKKGDSAWELVIVLLSPFDALAEEKDRLQKGMDAAAEEKEFDRAAEFKKRLERLGDVKSVRESIVENMNSGQEHIYVWMPWNTRHDIPAPSLPTLNLMSLVLLLRQLETTGLHVVRKWIQRQKEKGASHLYIQQLIADSPDSSTPEAIEGLRSSLSGDILQGVLQMEEPIFPYAN